MDRVQWFRYQAQRDRWAEEVEILESELRRAKLFFKFYAETWKKLPVGDMKSRYEHGVSAYCHKVAAMFSKLADGVPDP